MNPDLQPQIIFVRPTQGVALGWYDPGPLALNASWMNATSQFKSGGRGGK
ncbi:hypothetical protein [Verrucomicrobium spinosum]|nr:hypothetical protein [Verrucomicrobium spinosum]